MIHRHRGSSGVWASLFHTSCLCFLPLTLFRVQASAAVPRERRAIPGLSLVTSGARSVINAGRTAAIGALNATGTAADLAFAAVRDGINAGEAAADAALKVGRKGLDTGIAAARKGISSADKAADLGLNATSAAISSAEKVAAAVGLAKPAAAIANIARKGVNATTVGKNTGIGLANVGVNTGERLGVLGIDTADNVADIALDVARVGVAAGKNATTTVLNTGKAATNLAADGAIGVLDAIAA